MTWKLTPEEITFPTLLPPVPVEYPPTPAAAPTTVGFTWANAFQRKGQAYAGPIDPRQIPTESSFGPLPASGEARRFTWDYEAPPPASFYPPVTATPEEAMFVTTERVQPFYHEGLPPMRSGLDPNGSAEMGTLPPLAPAARFAPTRVRVRIRTGNIQGITIRLLRGSGGSDEGSAFAGAGRFFRAGDVVEMRVRFPGTYRVYFHGASPGPGLPEPVWPGPTFKTAGLETVTVLSPSPSAIRIESPMPFADLGEDPAWYETGAGAAAIGAGAALLSFFAVRAYLQRRGD